MKKFSAFVRESKVKHPLSTMIQQSPGVHPLAVEPGVKHALTNVDLDVDSDVDKFDKPSAGIPDEIAGAGKKTTEKMKKKYAGEKAHTKVGVAYESTVMSFKKFISNAPQSSSSADGE